jgi:anti-sigma B factor antagonist
VSEAGAEALRIDISPAHAGAPALVVLSGEMDIVSSREFAEAIAELEGTSADHVVIDLGGITFIDSSGINALVQVVHAVEARGGSAVLASPSRVVQRVFEIACVGDVVTVVDDRDEALRRGSVALEPDRLADEL